jgi:hypothetical protein
MRRREARPCPGSMMSSMPFRKRHGIWIPGEAQEKEMDRSLRISTISAGIAFLSMLVTGFLAYENLRISRQSFRMQHQPNLSVSVEGLMANVPGSVLGLKVVNHGDTEALNVHVVIAVGKLGAAHADPVEYGKDLARVGAGSTSEVLILLDKDANALKETTLRIFGSVRYVNEEGQSRGPDNYCATYNSSIGILPCPR